MHARATRTLLVVAVVLAMLAAAGCRQRTDADLNNDGQAAVDGANAEPGAIPAPDEVDPVERVLTTAPESDALSCAVGDIDGPVTLGVASVDNDTAVGIVGIADAIGVDIEVAPTSDGFALNSGLATGQSGWDLVVFEAPSINTAVDAGGLQKLNHQLLTNMSNVPAAFSVGAFREGFDVAVPFDWSYDGFGLNTTTVGADHPRSWDFMFSDYVFELDGRVSLPDDPRRTIGAALRAQGYSANSTEFGELIDATDLLWSAFDALEGLGGPDTADRLVAGELDAAYVSSTAMVAALDGAPNAGDFSFFVPSEAGVGRFVALAIPVNAPSPCAAHAVINALLDPGSSFSAPAVDPAIAAFVEAAGIDPTSAASIEPLVDLGAASAEYGSLFGDFRAGFDG